MAPVKWCIRTSLYGLQSSGTLRVFRILCSACSQMDGTIAVDGDMVGANLSPSSRVEDDVSLCGQFLQPLAAGSLYFDTDFGVWQCGAHLADTLEGYVGYSTFKVPPRLVPLGEVADDGLELGKCHLG